MNSDLISENLTDEHISLISRNYLEIERFSEISQRFDVGRRPFLLDLDFVISKSQVGGSLIYALKSLSDFRVRRGLNAPIRFAFCTGGPAAFCTRLDAGDFLIVIDLSAVFMLTTLACHLSRFSAFRELLDRGHPIPADMAQIPDKTGDYWELGADPPTLDDLFNFHVLRDVGLWSMIRHELTHIAHGHLALVGLIKDGAEFDEADQTETRLALEMNADSGSVAAAFEHLRPTQFGKAANVNFPRNDILTIGGMWLSFKALEIMSAGRPRSEAGTHPSIGERQMMALSLIGQHLLLKFPSDQKFAACGVVVAIELERFLRLIGGKVSTVQEIFSEFNDYNDRIRSRLRAYARIYPILSENKVQMADLPPPQEI